MLHLDRDDLILRTAQIDTRYIFPCTVRYMNGLDVRGWLPGELFGVSFCFSGGEVIEERTEWIFAVHSIVLEDIVCEPLLTSRVVLTWMGVYRCLIEWRRRMVRILGQERSAQVDELLDSACLPTLLSLRQAEISDGLGTDISGGGVHD